VSESQSTLITLRKSTLILSNRIKASLEPKVWYSKDHHGEFPWATVQEAMSMSKLAQKEELLSSKEFKRFIACLACGTILVAIVDASQSILHIPYGQDTEALVERYELFELTPIFSGMVILKSDFIKPYLLSIADYYLGPMTYDILLGNYTSLITTILLYPIFVQMGPAICSGLFAAFTCVLSYSICHIDRDCIYNGRPRLFRVIFFGITSFPLFNTFAYRYYRPLASFTTTLLPIVPAIIWTMIPLDGRTPDELAETRGFSGVLRLLGVEDEAYRPRSAIVLGFKYFFTRVSFGLCLYILYSLPAHMAFLESLVEGQRIHLWLGS
jgi:hypothetical protein